MKDRSKEPAQSSKLLRGIFLIVIMAGIFFVSAFVVGGIYKIFPKFAESSQLMLGLTVGLKLTLVVAAGLSAFLLLAFNNRTIRNTVTLTDDRGVSFMEQGTHGTSKWLSEAEAGASYRITPIEDTTYTVYGQFSSSGEKVVSFKPYFGSDEGTEEQNNLIIGSPNTGKSYAFVRTELIQSVLRGDSFIVTDPSGELYSSLNKFCLSHGLVVKVLNLSDPSRSDFWNCLGEVIDKQTGRLDGTRLNEFSDIYMRNLQAEGKQDAFWYNSAKNLLSAVIGLNAYIRESYILNAYRELYTEIGKGSPDYLTLRTRMSGMASLNWCEEKIHEACIQNGYSDEEVSFIIGEIKRNAPEFSLKETYRIMQNFADFGEEAFEPIPDTHPARISYRIYSTSDSPTVRTQALQGLLLNFSLFVDQTLLEVLSHDGIELERINEVQSAYFVIMNDKTDVMKPISSLFFSFFFKDAQDTFDRAQQIAVEQGVPNPRLAVTVMLDEFFSVGVIGGSENRFTVVMSNSRKRKLHISIIIQAYTQIEQLYGESNSNVIQSCCSTIIFLGCNDQRTAAFISEFASGKATVLSESHSESEGLFAKPMNNDLSMSTSQRSVLTIDEVRRWKGKVLVVKRGVQPLKLNAFPWKEHPCFLNGELQMSNIYNTIRPIAERLAELEENSVDSSKNNDFDSWLYTKIHNLKPEGCFIELDESDFREYFSDENTSSNEAEISPIKANKETVDKPKANRKNRNRGRRVIHSSKIE